MLEVGLDGRRAIIPIINAIATWVGEKSAVVCHVWSGRGASNLQ